MENGEPVIRFSLFDFRFPSKMRRYLFAGLVIFVAVSAALGLYFFNRYWIHRYDEIIEKQSGIYRLDKDLVWSVIYEETYFRAWQIGADEEVGLMQVTPTAAREWAKETGFREFERQTAENTVEFLRDPERNIQIGCWYLEKMREKYRDFPAHEAMMLAAYNAGASRVEEWTRSAEISRLPEREFVERINIASTKSYVTSILERYREKKTN
ncbi:MAG TPA: lytic transglycosylase domain-containing protein [Pyrinomonadaceae bacterium]